MKDPIKITIIFPGREVEMGKANMPVMPLAPTLLAALTPEEHEVALVDMFYGDVPDYDSDWDLVAITVRTPLAVIAYDIAAKFMAKGKTVILGGPHTFALPQEAKQHATAVAIGEAEALWPVILEDVRAGRLKAYYVCGPYKLEKLEGAVYHQPGSPIYDEYLEQGRILTEYSWDAYGGNAVVFQHPTMDPKEMFKLNKHVLHDGFSMGRIIGRTIHTFKNRLSPGVALNSFFTQLGMRKAFRQHFEKI